MITLSFTEREKEKIGIISIINVSILTIIERKLLSKIQRRKGPRRIILQGIIDGIKVILKERIYRESYKYNISIYINIIIIVILWELLPISFTYKEINRKYRTNSISNIKYI